MCIRDRKQSGFSVDCAFDGDQALSHFRTVAYDAAVLDVMIPKLDGLSLLRRLRDEKTVSYTHLDVYKRQL